MEWLSTIWVLVPTLAIAALVQGASGFGFALVVAPVVGFVDPTLLPAVLLLWLLPLNSYLVLRERHSIDAAGARWILLARLVSTPAGLAMLVMVPDRHAGALVGGMTICVVLVTFIVPPFDPGRSAYLGAGLMSGISETATGVGGPPLALVYQHRPAAEVRSTVALCSFVGELASLGLLLLYGRVSMRDLVTAAVLLPAAVVGASLSGRIRHRLNGPRLRVLVLVFAVVSSLVLIF